jgi:hypothetical protein
VLAQLPARRRPNLIGHGDSRDDPGRASRQRHGPDVRRESARARAIHQHGACPQRDPGIAMHQPAAQREQSADHAPHQDPLEVAPQPWIGDRDHAPADLHDQVRDPYYQCWVTAKT